MAAGDDVTREVALASRIIKRNRKVLVSLAVSVVLVVLLCVVAGREDKLTALVTIPDDAHPLGLVVAVLALMPPTLYWAMLVLRQRREWSELQDAPLWRDDPGVSPAATVMLAGAYTFDEEVMQDVGDAQDRMIDATLLALVHRRCVSVTREGELLLHGAPTGAYASESDLYHALEALRYEGGGRVFLDGTKSPASGALASLRVNAEDRALALSSRILPAGSSSDAWMRQLWLDADAESGSRSQLNPYPVMALGLICSLVSAVVAMMSGFLLVGLLACVWGTYVWFDALRKRPRLSPELSQAVVRLKGLERWLEDFTRLEEASAADLMLWDGYMVYATAMGIPDDVWDHLSVELEKRPVAAGSAPVLDVLGARGEAGLRAS